MITLAEEVRAQLDYVRELYHRLVLVVGRAGSGKTTALRELAASGPFPYINLNLALSQRLLDFTSKARPLRLPRLLDEVVGATGGDVVLLDNIEILFDPALKQDPLRCLQSVSRNRTIVAGWSGSATGKALTARGSSRSTGGPSDEGGLRCEDGHVDGDSQGWGYDRRE